MRAGRHLQHRLQARRLHEDLRVSDPDLALWGRVGRHAALVQPGEGPTAHAPCRLARRALSPRRARGRLRRRRRFSGEADPASAVPADAHGSTSRSRCSREGDLRDDALDAAGKVLRTDDPEGKIREFIDKALARGRTAKLDYDKDIKPWLGERAGVWFSTRLDDEGDPGGAAIIGITDPTPRWTPSTRA